MNRTLTLTKQGGTVTIWNGLNNLEIDGTDYPTDSAWRKAIVDEVKNQISNWTIDAER